MSTPLPPSHPIQITWTIKAFFKALDEEYHFVKGGDNERIVSYLPLSHIGAQVGDIYMSINGAGTVYFAQPDALKGSIVQTLREARPTLFAGVPR